MVFAKLIIAHRAGSRPIRGHDRFPYMLRTSITSTQKRCKWISFQRPQSCLIVNTLQPTQDDVAVQSNHHSHAAIVPNASTTPSIPAATDLPPRPTATCQSRSPRRLTSVRGGRVRRDRRGGNRRVEMSSARLPVRLAKGRVSRPAPPVVWVGRATPGMVSSNGFGLGRGCPGLGLHRSRRRLSGLALHLMY